MNYVITGTNRGIGLAMTRQLLEEGQSVFALARNPDNAKELNQLKEQYKEQLKIFSVDVTNEKQVSSFAKELNQTVDVLINNAGVYGESATFETLSLEQTEKTISINSIAPMRMTRALLPQLQKSKNPKVINITSLMGSIQDNESGAYYGYRMSKAALNMFHKSFSIDYPKIVSLVIHPGWVKTDMGGENAPTMPKESAQGILSIVQKATLKDRGKFFDFEGDELPW